MKRRRKKTGEKKVFLEIWEEREHICTNCKEHLGSQPIVNYFAHIKPKSTHPELRLEKDNIQLMCMACHYAFDFQGIDKFNSLTR